MSLFFKVLCGILLLLNYCMGADPQKQEPKKISKKMSSSRPSSFSVLPPVRMTSVEERNRATLDTFHQERAALIQKITRTSEENRWQIVVVFDYDGVMDLNKDIHKVEAAERYPQGFGLYEEVSRLGATALISSARNQPETVVQSLRKLGMDNLPEHMQEECAGDYEIKWAGNVISARLQDRPTFPGSDYYRSKRAAALWFYKKMCQERGITDNDPSLLSLNLIDDQDANIQTFIEGGAGRLFDIDYPAPEGITFPPSWLFSNQ